MFMHLRLSYVNFQARILEYSEGRNLCKNDLLGSLNTKNPEKLSALKRELKHANNSRVEGNQSFKIGKQIQTCLYHL